MKFFYLKNLVLIYFYEINVFNQSKYGATIVNPMGLSIAAKRHKFLVIENIPTSTSSFINGPPISP